ncbi:MAG TPA: ABC transporter substrate-binding protein [Polyangiales bacterium]|nr:ABC transporter substrate-binding protein [Polyangiales bacterium]
MKINLQRFSGLSAVLLTSVVFGACNKPEAPVEPEKKAEEQKAPEQAPPPATKEIKLGQTMPYSGPASAYGTIGKLHSAYFKMVNEEGGIDGYKINLLSLDDGYSPPKTVEQTRKLVEEEQVVAMFSPLGTATNSAIQKYLNGKKVPQLFVSSGATKWGDPANFPWTMGFNPSYQLEGKIYGKYIAKEVPKGKIAVLYQNDDYGKDLLEGLKAGLGAAAKNIVKEASYETSDPTVDSQVIALKGSKADVFVNITTPKFAAQAVRKAYDSGWKPKYHFLNNVGASIGSVIKPAGPEKAKGAYTVQYYEDPLDTQYDADPGMVKYKAFLKKWYPEGQLDDGSNVYAYIEAQTMVQVLKQCAGNFTSENIMKQAASLKDFKPDLLLPGITVNTGEKDFFLFDQLALSRFDGTIFKMEGSVIKGD